MEPTVYHRLLTAVREYRVPPEAIELLSAHKPLMIAGVTAAGKNSVSKYLSEASQWQHVITHTTRQPRANEQSGETYWFVDDEQMLGLMQNREMVEVKVVHGDTIYGTSIAAYKQIVQAGYKPLLIIDIQGAKTILEHVSGIQAVFLLPPSFEAWIERIDKRGAMSHVERSHRLRSARTEIEEAMGSRHFLLVVNHDVHTTAREILANITDPSRQHRTRELAAQLIEHTKSF